MSDTEFQGGPTEKHIVTITTGSEEEDAAVLDAILASLSGLGSIVGNEDSMVFLARICPCDACKAKRGE